MVQHQKCFPSTCLLCGVCFKPSLQTLPDSTLCLAVDQAAVDYVSCHIDKQSFNTPHVGKIGCMSVIAALYVSCCKSICKQTLAGLGRCVVWCCVVSCRVVSCRVVSCRVVSCCVCQPTHVQHLQATSLTAYHSVLTTSLTGPVEKAVYMQLLSSKVFLLRS